MRHDDLLTGGQGSPYKRPIALQLRRDRAAFQRRVGVHVVRTVLQGYDPDSVLTGVDLTLPGVHIGTVPCGTILEAMEMIHAGEASAQV